MLGKHDRLDGWKAIAGFFGRERTTVIRWARERNMPVHALPGGKTRTVYALVSELEAWAQSGVSAPTPATGLKTSQEAPPLRTVEPPHSYRWLWTAAGALVMVLFIVALMSPQTRMANASLPSMQHALPADPEMAALFLQARDEAAQRDAASLSRSIADLHRVTRAAPSFAPAYAQLAEAYILDTEDGALASDLAFDRAMIAATHALRLDPRSAAAHRALGFVQYWWKHEPGIAGLEFRKAIQSDPESAQTHFWYANILADAGEERQAVREFNAARLEEPGSDQIGADFAWALWIFGHGDRALSLLQAILAVHPNNIEAYDCFGSIALARGDYQTFLMARRKRVLLRHDPGLASDTRTLEAAFDQGGGKALIDTALSRELGSQAEARYPDHSLAAFYASLAGDRAELLRIADLARHAGERWGAAGFVGTIRSRWASDPVVKTALDQLSASPVEAS